MLELAPRSKVVEELERIVGSDFVSTNQADLYMYSQDMTAAEPAWPDVVVLPQTVEEVQAIVRMANTEKVPVTPYIAGGNIGGLTIPLRGGICLDLKRMNRIIEVNPVDMYAVIEPGVQFGHIKAYLEKNHPDLVYTYAYSPPYTSIMGNALLQGLDNLSFRYGSAAHWVSGLEVVLPTGELVRVGSCALSKCWHDLDPLPDLAGLFLGWQGGTGIVTKMAVSVWPKPKHIASVSYMVYSLEDAWRFIKEVSRTRVVDDMTGTSYTWRKRSQFVLKGVKKPPLQVRQPGEPEFGFTVEVTGNTSNELNARLEVLHLLKAGALKDMRLDGPMPADRGVLPGPAGALLSGGGGLTWVGTYGPVSNWCEAARRGCELQDKHGFTRSMYTRIMREGHFAALRWLLPFDKDDPDMVARIRALTLDQARMALDLGYIPYKTPNWVIRMIEERADPAWVELMRRVKRMMDPNNIMNPGRWGQP